jgi:hypothetical protein
VRPRRLVLDELLLGHVQRLGHEAALRNFGLRGPAQPVGDEVGRDVVGEAALESILCSISFGRYLQIKLRKGSNVYFKHWISLL